MTRKESVRIRLVAFRVVIAQLDGTTMVTWVAKVSVLLLINDSAFSRP